MRFADVVQVAVLRQPRKGRIIPSILAVGDNSNDLG